MMLLPSAYNLQHSLSVMFVSAYLHVEVALPLYGKTAMLLFTIAYYRTE